VTTQSLSAEDSSNPSSIDRTLFGILAAVSFCHLLNDMVQSLLPSIYPILKTSFNLGFRQIGLITLVFQITASMLQPLVGVYTDKKPMPYSLSIGMTFTLAGLILLALAPSFHVVLLAAVLVGVGSAVFHPESSRVARMASGGRHGLAQSLFQVGGNAGSAIGPLLAGLSILPHGRKGVLWFSIAALLGIVILVQVGHWCKTHHLAQAARRNKPAETSALSRPKTVRTLAILIALMFSKFFYLAGVTSYYTFYLIDRFHVSIASSQIHLFVFLGAVAAGTLVGGHLGDRFGRKLVIWCSILGVLPFTLLLPHASLFWTGPLSVIIGFVLASAFPAILVYGQELIPGRVGMVSGLFFGLAFGMGGIGAAVLGDLADRTSVITVYQICAWLPAIGLLTAFLPNLERRSDA
jgi:FSR family fosmidomycin resistance protein-like MFS transporter